MTQMLEIINRANEMIKKSIIFFLFFSMPVIGAEESICASDADDKNIQASTPTNQFDFTQDGNTVTDKKTGLMWARCPWNHHWELGSCVNDAFGQVSWASSLEKANDTIATPYLTFSDWRVPNIKELSSIVERKCANLSINHKVFGGAASGVYWSNTHINSDIWVVNLVSGQVTVLDPAVNTAYLRLVRDCQSLVGGVCQD